MKHFIDCARHSSQFNLFVATVVMGCSIACGSDDNTKRDGAGGGPSPSTGGETAGGAAGTPSVEGGGAAGSGGAGADAAGAGGAGADAAGAGGANAGCANGGGAGVETAGWEPRGTIEVLSDDASALLTPTTPAIRGDNVWVPIGQFRALFSGDTPEPFTAVSIPLAGGAVGESPISLPGDDYYPEGIATLADGTLFIGSYVSGAIVSVPPDSTTATVFLAAGSVAQRGVMGLAPDEARGLLWFCDSGPAAAGGGGALVAIGLADATEAVRHEMPDPDAGSTFCNSVVLTPAGDLLASDSSGRIFRVPSADAMAADSAAVWLEAAEIAPSTVGGFGINGLVLVGDTLIATNGAGDGLLKIDLDNPSSGIEPISLTLDGAAATLCGPDGMVQVPGTHNEVIVVENGLCDDAVPRVVKVTLGVE